MSETPRETQPRGRRLRRLAIDAGIFVLIVLAIGAWQTRDLVSSGTPAPAVELRDLDGVTHRLEEWKGRTVLLNFWAPWCGVCKAAAPNVASIASDTVVISIALSWKSEEEVARVARESGIPGLVILGDEKVREAFAISAYPTFYVVGGDGEIRSSVVGYATWLGLRARLLWASLVG